MKYTDYKNFRDFLAVRFDQAKKRNPNYSLRAFSNSIGIDQSHLSKILNNKASLSRQMLIKLSNNLNLPSRAIRHFLKSEIESLSATEPAPYNVLGDSIFALLSDWSHLAILELTQVPEFKADPHWISEKLGLSVSLVNKAIKRLSDLDFIEIQTDGSWIIRSQHNSWGHDEITSAAKRRFQIHLLEEAINCIKTLGTDERDNSNLMIAVDKNLLPEIKERIQEFKNSLRLRIEEHGQYNEVYNLSIAMFPLTKTKRSRS